MTHTETLDNQPTRVYRDEHLAQIAMPMGGIGAGCLCLNGYGGVQDFAIRNRPAVTAMPDGHAEGDAAFALLHVKGEKPVTKLLEGPLPQGKIYDQGLQSQGYRHGGYEGLPRFESCRFESGYPFGTVFLEDPEVPLTASVTGWSPFIPADDVASSMPCAILEYRFENTGTQPVEFEFSYHLTNLAGGETRNGLMGPPETGGDGGGVHFSNTESRDAQAFGDAALYALGWQPRRKAMWLRGGWFDGISALWREVSSGRFVENDGTQSVDEPDSRSGGSLLAPATLQPGESVTYPVVIAWHFPNPNLTFDHPAAPAAADCGPGCDCAVPPTAEPTWRPFFAGVWEDSRAVALHVADGYTALRARTLAFQRAMFSSTLPAAVLDAITANLAILKSPTVMRQENGNVWAWEGCFTYQGCCTGSCTHVWNYAQAMPHLFPALERTLREQELDRSMNEQGHVNFRSALPDGPASHGYHARPVRLGRSPAPDETVTIRPQPARSIAGVAAWASQRVPFTLAAKTPFQLSSSIPASARPAWPHTPPAARARIPRVPSMARIWATRAAQPARSERSSTWAGAARASPTCVTAGSMSARCTRAPAAARPWAMARPMPWAAPVTRATLP